LLGVHLSPEHRSSTHETTRFIYSSIIPIRIFLIAFPRHHSCPYCPLVEKGWCVHATQTSQERQTQKEKKRQQLGRCQRAHIPNQEPSAHQQQVKETRVRAARSVPTSMLHRGTPDESAAPPLPANPDPNDRLLFLTPGRRRRAPF
jgi:hypothetical protein